MSNAQIAELCRLRGVQDPCERCHGLGVRSYSNTATWRGGIGGQAFTRDTCDTCWGSGDKFHKFFDLRKQRDEERVRVTTRVHEYFAKDCGSYLDSFVPALEALTSELDRLARGRKERPPFFQNACSLLAKKLKAGIAAAQKERRDPVSRAPSGVAVDLVKDA